MTVTKIERMDPRSGIVGRLRFTAAGFSSQGQGRSHNEDAWYISPDADVMIVADGVGGHDSGEMASRLAISHFVQRVRLSRDLFLKFGEDSDNSTAQAVAVADCIKSALRAANDIVLALGSGRESGGPGTTIVLSVRVGRTLFVASVGDSRVYRLRSGKLEQLTVDDSWVELLVTAGSISREEARTHPRRNLLVLALGQDDFEAEAEDVSLVRMAPGDRFLLSSDGLHDALDSDLIASVATAPKPPADLAAHLVEQAVEAGSRDDVTCIVMDVAAAS